MTDAMLLEPQIEEDVSAPRRLTPRILLAYMVSASVAEAQGDPPGITPAADPLAPLD